MSWRDQPRDSRGRWTKRGGVLAIFTALTALVVGIGGAGAGTDAGGGAGGAGSPPAARSAGGGQARGPGGRPRARGRGVARVVQRLRDRGWKVTEHDDADDDCLVHSYGQVRDFFQQHSCVGLDRALLEVRDGQLSVVLAVASVDMPDEASASELEQLLDRPGTGNLTELTRDGVPPRDTRWSGEHRRSTAHGVTVVTAQAAPGRGTAQAVRFADLVAGVAVG